MIDVKRIMIALLFLPCLSGCSGEPESIDELKAAGQKAFLAEDYQEARQYFLKAVAKAPSDKELLYYTGMAYKRDYQYDSALFYLKRLDLLYPNDRETNLRLYEIALALEDWDYALAALGGLIRTGDNIEQYYSTYAELWAKNDHPGNAYYYAKKAIEVDPDRREWYVQTANLALTVEGNRSCLRWIDSAITRFGEEDEFFGAKAYLLARLDDYPAAEEIYRSLLSKDTGSVSARINLANVLDAQEDKIKKQEALELYRSVRDKATPDFRIDSLIRELEAEIK